MSLRKNNSIKRKWLSLFIILLPNLLISLNTYMLQVALPTIQRDLDASFLLAQLLLSGYALGLSATLIISGKLGDLFGRKKLLLIGTSGFLAMALIGGLTHSASILVLVRLMQGVFGACIQPQVLVLMRLNFTEKEQPLIFAIYGALIGIGFTFGLTFGGIISYLNWFNLGWRNIFFINIPLCLLILVGFKLLDETPLKKNDSLDFVGSGLLVLSIFLIVNSLFALKSTSNSKIASFLLILGFSLLLLFSWYEKKQKEKQKACLIDFSIVKEPCFALGMLTILAVYLSMFSLFFLVTYYGQIGLDYDILTTSWSFLPLGVGFISMSLLSGSLLKKWGQGLLVLGNFLMVISCFALSFSSLIFRELLHPCNCLLLLSYGCGLGLTTTPLVGIILRQLKPEFAGIGSAMLNTFMYLANSLGVCLISLVFSQLLKQPVLQTDLTTYQQSFSGSLLITGLLTSGSFILIWQLTKKEGELSKN